MGGQRRRVDAFARKAVGQWGEAAEGAVGHLKKYTGKLFYIHADQYVSKINFDEA